MKWLDSAFIEKKELLLVEKNSNQKHLYLPDSHRRSAAHIVWIRRPERFVSCLWRKVKKYPRSVYPSERVEDHAAHTGAKVY